MSYSYVIDSYAWIEYFRASKMGGVVSKYVEGEMSATPSIVVAELSRKLLRAIEEGEETEKGRKHRLEFIRSSTQIVYLDFDIAESSGEIDMQRKREVKGWSLADSIILATARSANARVVTGDEYFRDLSGETVMIE